MKNNPKYKNFQEVKAEIETNMIQNILEYLKKGVFPNNGSNKYMNAYTAVQSFADEGDKQSSDLMKYHNRTIELYIQDCNSELNKEINSNLIDAFIVHSNNITLLIYWMNRIFCYLDRFYMKAKVRQNLAKCALNLFKLNFFENYKENIFIEVNKLIKEDRLGNKENRPKIKEIMKTLKFLDFEFPKIVRENNKIFWIEEKPNEQVDTEIENSW